MANNRIAPSVIACAVSAAPERRVLGDSTQGRAGPQALGFLRARETKPTVNRKRTPSGTSQTRLVATLSELTCTGTRTDSKATARTGTAAATAASCAASRGPPSERALRPLSQYAAAPRAAVATAGS